ncbi:MAG: CBS domain-containing protein [Chloroflexi bacterium]|nr:CBS domain-containing protein [Chloroflexota bacterium]
MASGLPIEGKMANYCRAGSVARADVPTCRLTDRVADALKQVQASDHCVCVVTNDQGVVLGRLGERALLTDPEGLVEQVMESGPTTTRPDDPLESITERLRGRGVDSILVTTPDGRLVGILYLEDAERILAEEAA